MKQHAAKEKPPQPETAFRDTQEQNITFSYVPDIDSKELDILPVRKTAEELSRFISRSSVRVKRKAGANKNKVDAGKVPLPVLGPQKNFLQRLFFSMGNLAGNFYSGVQKVKG